MDMICCRIGSSASPGQVNFHFPTSSGRSSDSSNYHRGADPASPSGSRAHSSTTAQGRSYLRSTAPTARRVLWLAVAPTFPSTLLAVPAHSYPSSGIPQSSQTATCCYSIIGLEFWRTSDRSCSWAGLMCPRSDSVPRAETKMLIYVSATRSTSFIHPSSFSASSRLRRESRVEFVGHSHQQVGFRFASHTASSSALGDCFGFVIQSTSNYLTGTHSREAYSTHWKWLPCLAAQQTNTPRSVSVARSPTTKESMSSTCAVQQNNTLDVQH